MDVIPIQEMQDMEYTPIVQERTEPEVECVLTDTVETEHATVILIENLASRVGPVDSVVISSDQTTEARMSLVTLLKGEPSPNYRDCGDGDIPSVQQNEKVHRRSSPSINEQSDDCEEFKQPHYFIKKSKRHSSVISNSNAHNRRYPISK